MRHAGENHINKVLNRYVDAGELAGAAALVWRDGRLAHIATIGRRDLRAGLPVERDTIFRIASMTKPVTTVAALMLHEEGRFDLDEPITNLRTGVRAHARAARSGRSARPDR